MSKRLDYWATIELSDVTLFVTSASEDTRRTYDGSGRQWLPYLIVGEFSQTFQSLDVPAEIPASVTVTLVNKDGWLDPYIGFGRQARVWDNRVVTIRYGANGRTGDAFDGDMQNEFKGLIRRGTLKHTRDAVTFTLFDIRQGHDKPLLDTFDADTFPDAQDGVNGSYIPVVYGDFTAGGAPAQGGRLPAYAIDIAQTNKIFVVAAHPVTIPSATCGFYDGGTDTYISPPAVTLAQVLPYSNKIGSFIAGETITGGTSGATATVNALSTATFLVVTSVTGFFTDGETVTGGTSGATCAIVTAMGGFILNNATQAYLPDEGDIVTVDCKGRDGSTYFTLSPLEPDAAMYQYAVNIMADLLISYGGAVIGDIHSSVWESAHSTGDSHLNRRWIGEQTTVMSAIAELAFENNYLFFTSPELYELNYDLPKTTVTATVRDAQPVAESVESVYDPDSVYCNKATSSYDGVAVGDSVGNYRYSVSLANATAAAEYGSTIERQFTFHWLYQKENVSLQTERKLLVLSSKAHYVDFGLAAVDPSATFWRLTLADIVTLTHWQYAASPLQIRELRRDAGSGRISVRALAIQDAFQVSQWSGGTVTVPTGSTYPVKWNDAGITHTPSGRYF